MSLGKRLKILRTDKQLNQGQAAKLLNLSTSTLSLYESDKRNPDSEILKNLAQFYNVSADYLIGLESEHFKRVSEHPLEEIIHNIDSKKIPFLDEESKLIIKSGIEHIIEYISTLKKIGK